MRWGARLGLGMALAQALCSVTAARAQVSLPTVVVHANQGPHQAKPKRRRPAAPAARAPAPAANAISPNGPPVTATTAGPVSGYRALTAVTATKTQTPIDQIPQTVVVLPRSVIDDQKPVTQNELFHDISDVSGMPDYAPYGVYYKVRGFVAERYVDGLPNYNDGGDYSSTVNTERLEVIKGPGGLFYQGGLGVIGGVINTVSKLPQMPPAYLAGVNVGSFDLYNPWFDLDQPRDKNGNVLFRMTGEFSRSHDYVDVIQHNRFSLNPTFSFDNHDGSTLIVQASVSQRQGQDYVGLPATGTLDSSVFSIRPNLYFGNPDIPKTTSDYQGLTVRFDRELNGIWSFNVAARVESQSLNEQSQPFFFNTPDVPPSSFAVDDFHLHDISNDVSVAPNLIAKFNAGPTQNTVLLGADYDRVHANVAGWSNVTGLVDLANPNPVFPAYTDPIPNGTLQVHERERITNGGLIAQWQSTIFDRLHLLAGVREAYVEDQNDNFVFQSSYDSRETKPLSRLGASYDVLRGIAVFAGYGEGLRAERYFTGTVAPKPEQSQQIEGGLKFALPSGLAGTFSLFDINYSNVAAENVTMPLQETQVGQERSKGFDTDVTWQPVAGLSILANYAHVDARVVQSNLYPVGNLVDFVPQNSGRLWANYKFQTGWLRNFSIGAGLYSASRQTLDLTDQFWTPGYTIFDGKIAYEAKDWTLALVGKNLTNRQYFIPYSFVTIGHVAPGTPLSVMASLTVRN